MNFESKIDEIERVTNEDQKKRIHFQSLSNFIYHYNIVKKEKKLTTKLLEDYFQFIELNNYNLSNRESEDAYFTYIRPICSIYKRYYGFSIWSSKQMFFSYSLILNLLFWYIFHSFVINIPCFILSIWYFRKLYLKIKDKKIC